MSKAKKIGATLIAVGLLSAQPAWGVLPIPITYAKSSSDSLKTKWNQQAQDALEKLLPFVPQLPALVYGFISQTPGFSYIDAFTGKSVFLTKK